MKKIRVLTSMLVFIITLIGVNYTNLFAVDATQLEIHYHRYDGNYDDWYLWIWAGSESGYNVYFDETDAYGGVATIDLTTSYYDGITQVGLLIRDDAWNKDYEVDRFISITSPDASGIVDVYFLQGEAFFSYVSEDQAGCDPDNPSAYLCAQQFASGLLDVYLNSSLNVEFISTDVIDAADITLYDNGTPVDFTGFVSGETGTLDIVPTVNVSHTYMMEVNYGGEIIEQVIRVNVGYDTTTFATAYNYNGDLGVLYTPTETTFRLWAPVSSAVEVNLYEKGHPTSMRYDGVDDPYAVYELDYAGTGVWSLTLPGDLDGKYYTFNVVNSGTKIEDIQDPYGVTFGLNGQRAMVVDLDGTDPIGWDSDRGIDGYTNPNEAIIYELHVRDLTSSTSWGGPSQYAGLYMGFTVEDTSYTNSILGVTVSTGLAHLIELGITHVHLLPTYDQDWNDERNFQFNWGYNPQNYNSPEGGYSTDPYNGEVRLLEYKEMVMALHDNGINVINDVVYNHTGPGSYYSFNRIVPNYFYRLNADGSFSNGTGVGNETASERYMVNKFIVDSVTYWAEEFHIDGFRFDLMAVHDYETMNDVANAVEAIDEDIFVYGEPWGGGTIALPYDQQAGKQNLYRMPLISAFNDQIRNAIKGSPDGSDSGYVTNGQGIYDVMLGIAGSVNWGFPSSNQSVNYVSAHDNLTLYDKLKLVHNSSGYTDEIDYEARLANTIVLFSQGIPFLNSGVDFLRTKGGDSNSYDASDSINQLNWVRKTLYVDSFEYYKGIIDIRKEFDSFKMMTKSDIEANLHFIYPSGYGMIGYNLTKNGENIYIYHNGGAYTNEITLPNGAWKLLADRDEAGLEGLGTFANTYIIEEAETLVFVPGNSEDVEPSPTFKPVITNTISTAFEGANFRITSTSNIAQYSIDGGAFVTVETPATQVYIGVLEPGVHTVTIKDSSGSISDPFTVTIIQTSTETCEDGYHLEDGTCVLDEVDPETCDTGYIWDGEVCVLEEVPLTCETGYELIGEACVLIDDKTVDTGCFSAIEWNRLSLLLTMILGSAGLIILRKQK